MINLDETVQEFLIESRENLDQLDRDFVALEKHPGDREKTAAIFRAVHTIKGTAGFLGFTRLEHLTHAGESLLSLVRDGTLELDAEITSALLAMVDRVRSMLTLVESTGGDGERAHDDVIARLKELRFGRSSVLAAVPPLETPPAVPPTQTAVAAKPVAMPTADGPWVHASAEPPTDGGTTPNVMHREERPERAPLQPTTATPMTTASPMSTATSIATSTANGASATSAMAASALKKPPETMTADLNVRVDVGVLDRLMNLVGELVLARNQLVQAGARFEDQTFSNAAQRLSVITTDLQESVMKTRMQPIGTVWSKLPRVVRDLAVQLGKQIRLEMVGQETELDRTVLEAVKDSLTHIVRNSIDHGIETPDVRAAAGKPKTGTLTLRAFHEGGQVNVEISDDGAGIDIAAVKRKAIERGLIGADRAERMSELELMQLIFVPGFSTADRVSNISGRGVGMDVVKTNVERLGGTVEVAQRSGHGTTLRIKIPLTLAIMPAVIVSCDGQRYAIPQACLLELVRLDESDLSGAKIEHLQGSSFFRLRGELVPLVFLADALRTRPQGGDAANPDADVSHDAPVRLRRATQLGQGADVVVVKAAGRLLGVAVCEVIDTEEIVVKPLGRELRGIDVFAGATIMGDGRVALIIDVVGLARHCGAVDAESAASRDQMSRDERARPSSEDGPQEQTLLVFSIGEDEVMAIPLASVARIEEFSWDSIERVGRRPVVQYRQGILPLIDPGQTTRVGAVDNQRPTVTVIVFNSGQKAVGLVVHSILDIETDTFEVDRTAARDSVFGAAVVKGRVVELFNLDDAVRSYAPTLLPRSAV
jgi:two-component system chemotaxis sensor kinase CheA